MSDIFPSVSVVLPTYNQASNLQAAIASIRYQQWPNLEIVVVDDGSDDNTQQVMSQLSSSDLRYVRQANAGPASARNRGIKLAEGDWIAFLDADDLWLPGKLSSQFEEIKNNPEAAVCYTNVLLRAADGSDSIFESPSPQHPLFALLQGNQFGTPTMMIRRDCFEQIGGFDPELRTGEDWDMWLRLAARFRFAKVPEPVVLVRRPNNNQKYSSVLLEKCTLRILNRLFSSQDIRERWPDLATQRHSTYAMHYSVLAKSHLRQGRLIRSVWLACKSIFTHSSGLFFLAGRRSN